MEKRRWMTVLAAAMVAVAAACAPCVAGERDTPESAGVFATLTAGERIFAGNPVGVATNGLAYSADRTNMALTVVGRAEATAGEGSRVTARRGTFRFPNVGVTPASIGKPAYSAFDGAGLWGVADAADTNGVAVAIGIISDIDDGGVWVRVGN